MNFDKWPTCDPSTIPRPVTESEYADCYRTNVQEARRKVEDARLRFRQFRDAKQIVERVEGGWVCEGPTAAQALGDLIRWQSDLAHWSERLATAETNVAREAPPEPGWNG